MEKVTKDKIKNPGYIKLNGERLGELESFFNKCYYETPNEVREAIKVLVMHYSKVCLEYKEELKLTQEDIEVYEEYSKEGW